MNAFKSFAACLMIAVGFGGQSVSAADLVEPKKVDAIAKALFDDGWLFGGAIGLVNEHGTQFIGYGRISDKKASPPDGETIFEIGSISKVFTGLLLAQMVEDHQVKLDEAVQKLLGDSMTVPSKGDRQITLLDLATHSSGLPRMPLNFKPKDPTNPYADYSVEQLNQFISAHKLTRAPGEVSEYSNLGFGLLGHALALKSGMSYESLLRTKICQPLEMSDTSITLDASQQARLAQGHDVAGAPAANWDLPTLAGAGAIRSNVNDMLKFLAAEMGLHKTAFDKAIALTQQVQFKSPAKADNDEGLAWVIRRKGGVIWHNGQTGGYHSFAGFSPAARQGVVVLCNSASPRVDALGNRLLELLATGTADPFKLPKAIKLPSDAMEIFVGNYKFDFGTAAISLDADQLSIQVTGQPKTALYPESATSFFCRAVDAAVRFEKNDAGVFSRMVLHQNGQQLVAERQ